VASATEAFMACLSWMVSGGVP